VYTVELGKSGLVPLTSDKADKANLAWSPNGQALAFAALRDERWQLFQRVVATGNTVQLTDGPSDNREPTWSPDGKHIAFASNREGAWQIFVVSADGSGTPRRLTTSSASNWLPAWSPDGKQIAFTTNRDGNWEIYIMNADGTNPRNLTRHPAGDWYPTWSPDGQRLAFVSDRDGRLQVYVSDLTGSVQVNLTRSAASEWYPTWSPDGQRLAFVSRRDGNSEVYLSSLDGVTLTRVTANPADDLFPAWAPASPQSISPMPTATPTPTPNPSAASAVGYARVTIWHFPDNPNIDAMRSSLIYTLGQCETSLPARQGFIIGFEPGTAYQQIYIRDTSTILPAALYFYPTPFLRQAIEEFLYRQYDATTQSHGGDYNVIPGKGAISGLIAPDFYVDKHTTVSDEEVNLIRAAYAYFRATRDTAWLRQIVRGLPIIARLNQAMEWLLTNRFDETRGLVKRAHTTDWGDVKMESAANPTDMNPATDAWTASIFDQAMTYQALRHLAEMNQAVGDTEAAFTYKQRAEGLRRAADKYLWQPGRGFYRTHIHLTPLTHPFDEDAMVSIANAIAVYTGLTQHTSPLDALEDAQRRSGAIKPGLSLYPAYPGGTFAYPQMAEGFYQNGGLWDWWGGMQITAEFQHGLSRRALTHLNQVAADWARHPQDIHEWQMAITGALKGSDDYCPSASSMGEAVIEGLYGVSLGRGGVSFSPRLGEHNGFIRAYQPVTDLYVAYNYVYTPARVTIDYGTNYLGGPLRIEALIPEKAGVAAVLIDSQPVSFGLDKLNDDRYVSFAAPIGQHRVEIELGARQP